MQIPEHYANLTQIIESGDVEAGVAEAERLYEAGYGVHDIFQNAIVPCLEDIGQRFSRLELYLPDMIRAADVVKAIHNSLQRHLASDDSIGVAGKVVIGTAYGDIHDLGKNIVVSMLEVNGFEVHDLGINVSMQEFIKRAREVDADIIAISSLLSTSIPHMADVIERVKANEADRERFKILVGGGPVTPETAVTVGADGYGEDAFDAVAQARKLLEG
ncbi:B12-binding domain-containing protein [Chloroflexota bacterium]